MANAILTSAKTTYDSSSLSVANGQTAYAVRATGGMFDNVTEATFVEIRTNATITVKFNSTSDDGVIIASTDSPYKITPDCGLRVKEIYIANASGGTATVQIFLS